MRRFFEQLFGKNGDIRLEHDRIVEQNAEIGKLEPVIRRIVQIRGANLISGDIVLRAAKRGRNASELMGVVLSHYLAKWELVHRFLGTDHFRRIHVIHDGLYPGF
jgi:hypothetical protein